MCIRDSHGRRQHPYAGGNKHANKNTSKGPKCNPSGKGAVRNVSLRQTHVHSAAIFHAAKPKPAPYSRQGKPDKAKADPSSLVLRVPNGYRGGLRRVTLGHWDTTGDVHKLPFMKELRQELQWQMETLHRRYDCARKVLIKNPDLQKLPLRQAQGALQRLWCDYTYSKMSNRMASKTINQENARRMIATSGMLRKDRHEAYQSGRLSVYMEDVVRRLERLQRTGSEDEDPEIYLLTKRKQQIWDNQYLIHHGQLTDKKGSYEAGFILQEILGPRPELSLIHISEPTRPY